jgi:hypothetical protein
LSSGIGLSFAFRRATRSGPSEGLPIEDVGVAGAPYAMTRNDLLAGNVDLLAHCVGLLRQQPASGLAFAVDKRSRSVRFTAHGLDRLDIFLDGHPASSTAVADGGTVAITLVAGTQGVEAVGFRGGVVAQRRRIALK